MLPLTVVPAGSARRERDLIEGRIEPGERLKLPALVERFGVSMTVVREALTRLVEQRIVVAVPNRGFSVMPLSVEDLKDLTHVRLRLETMALRDSIERGALGWETCVVAAHHALKIAPRPASAARGDACPW